MEAANAALDGRIAQDYDSENWARATKAASCLIEAAHPKVVAVKNELLKFLSNESES